MPTATTKYRHGGKVFGRTPKQDVITMKYKTKQLKGDVVPAVLSIGEVVIPLSKVKRVTKLLKKNNIKLPNL